MIRPFVAILSLLYTPGVTVETIEVPDRGAVNLETFACMDTPRSTVVQRVCYDSDRNYLLVNVGGTYREYCRLSVPVFQAFLVAPSMGQFQRRKLSTGEFACSIAATE